MLYVSGLDRSTAERHFRWRALVPLPGGLAERPDPAAGNAALNAAHRAGRLTVETNDADRRVTVQWSDPAFGAPLTGSAIARPGYGGILLGATYGSRLRSDADRASNQPDGRRGHAAMRSSHPRHRLLNSPRRSMCCSPIRRDLRHPDCVARPRAGGTLQCVRQTRSRDAELVDDQGRHLHADRPAHPGRLARFGLRSRAGAALARPSRRSTV